MPVIKGKLIYIFISLLFILFASACSPSASATKAGTYPIDPTFSDFYREFGSASLLGPAISPSFIKEGITYQYIVAGLMAYDPNQVALQRFHFSPIASLEWKINDLVEPDPVNSSQLYINGHRIWEEILSFYNRYGIEIIGSPLTGVRINDEKQRYEQYFEGLGFYRNYSDPPGSVQLMPYGSWMCGENCQYQGTDIIPPSPSYLRNYSETEQLFLQASDRLGYGVTGAPLSSPQMGADGNYEMVFENVVLFIDPADGNHIKMRPLPTWLGIQPGQPVQETKAEWLSFYPVNGTLGYNVPSQFTQYIDSHGLIDYSGNPISEYRITPDNGYSQCFTNFCLNYHPTAPEQLIVRLQALGAEYNKNGLNTSVPDSSFDEALQINVWEQYPLIPSGQKQIIYMEVSRNEVGVAGVELSLILIQPDGITKSYRFDPTNSDGYASIEIDPINGPNGSIIQYKVCVLGSNTPQVCFTRTYTIWNQ